MGQKVKFETEQIQLAGDVPTRNCNAITFINKCQNSPAVNVMSVNNYPLYEGDSITFACLPGQVDASIYQVTISGAGSSREFWVIRKIDE